MSIRDNWDKYSFLQKEMVQKTISFFTWLAKLHIEES